MTGPQDEGSWPCPETGPDLRRPWTLHSDAHSGQSNQPKVSSNHPPAPNSQPEVVDGYTYRFPAIHDNIIAQHWWLYYNKCTEEVAPSRGSALWARLLPPPPSRLWSQQRPFSSGGRAQFSGLTGWGQTRFGATPHPPTCESWFLSRKMRNERQPKK